MRRGMRFSLLLLLLSLSVLTASAAENLGRGLVARPAEEGGVYLSWRLLPGDPQGVAFHVDRTTTAQAIDERLTPQPISNTTDFLDREAPTGKLAYTITPVVHGRPGGETAMVEVERPATTVSARPIQTIRLQGDYTVQKAGIADLDGDGRLDFVIKQPNDNVDPYVNYWKPSQGTYRVEAYLADGSSLWTHDLGWAIERGIWYSPYIAADLDGDGRAEVALKTAAEGDPRDADGRVQDGPEYLSILDGRTGKPLARIDWPNRQPFLDANPEPLRGYNYASRNQLAVARLDGKNPYLVVLRGTYNLMVVQAYRYENGQLKSVWRWDNVGLGKEYQGQGAHWTQAADIDGDGRDEIILGSLVLDDDGKPLWTTGMGHPDHVYLGDIDPNRPGLEIYYGYETRQKKNGMCLADAATGKILWGHDQPTRHVHGQGLCADLDPRYPGAECYSADTDTNKDFAYARLRAANGQVLSDENLGGFAPRAAYWDADPQRELIRGKTLTDLDATPQPSPAIEGSIVAVADLLGDWREEIVTTVPGEIRIYATTIPASDRRVTLMADPFYRGNVTHASMGYYQVPMTSYDLGTAKTP